jgi:hypothetical protein
VGHALPYPVETTLVSFAQRTQTWVTLVEVVT